MNAFCAWSSTGSPTELSSSGEYWLAFEIAMLWPQLAPSPEMI